MVPQWPGLPKVADKVECRSDDGCLEIADLERLLGTGSYKSLKEWG